MTGPNPANLLQAKLVRLWLAAVGATMPSDLSQPGTGWFDVGYTNQESARFRVTPEFQSVMAHQSDYPVMIMQVSTAAGIDIELMEWKGDNLKAVFGGGTITNEGDGLYRYRPPAFGGRTEVSAVLDVYDGPKHYRFCAARCFNRSEVELQLNKQPETRLPLRLSILGAEGQDDWYLLTNDPALAVA
jgi:hypothetical protein